MRLDAVNDSANFRRERALTLKGNTMKKLFLIAAMLATTAHAEVYKCGASYSSTPCGNDAVKIETPAATQSTHTAGANVIKVLTGKVVKIADGDTITIESGGTKEKIRFAQIDTPETSHFGSPTQPFGKEAGAALRQMVKDKNVRVEVEAVDQYGRNVGTVYVGNLNVNRELVKNGFAWVYRQYAHDPELIELEKAARSKKTGLWMLDNPIYPPDFRKSNK